MGTIALLRMSTDGWERLLGTGGCTIAFVRVPSAMRQALCCPFRQDIRAEKVTHRTEAVFDPALHSGKNTGLEQDRQVCELRFTPCLVL